jgi:hypothetical protein
MPPNAVPVPHFRKPLLETPFHARARELVQTDQFVPWAGYTTVDVFTSVEQEYFAIRNATTLYDLTPMVKYRIAGPDAVDYLNRLVTRDIRKLKPGRVSYVVWCNDRGHIIDDGTVFRLGAEEFRLCTAERQLDWLLDSALGFDVEIEEVTALRSYRFRRKQIENMMVPFFGPKRLQGLRDALAGLIAEAQIALRHWIVLLGGAAIPLQRLLVILLDTLTILVADAKVTLRLRVAGFGGLAHFLKSGPRASVADHSLLTRADSHEPRGALMRHCLAGRINAVRANSSC